MEMNNIKLVDSDVNICYIMSMNKYSKYAYLWPPRPNDNLAKGMMRFYERRGWIAQVKKNGTCSVIFNTPDGVIFKTRHDADHKQWAPTKECVAFFAALPTWSVFVAELLHNKTKHIKHTNYIHDVLVWDGDNLTGRTFLERQELLHETIFPQAKGAAVSHRNITDTIWLARRHDSNFEALFDTLDSKEDEGLVLKNPKAKLENCARQTSNAKWQVKCRKPTKNYGF